MNPPYVIRPQFQAVADAFPKLLRHARGAALAVYYRGELVIDIWTGTKDPAGEHPWDHDTMAMAWSATKGVTSAAVLLLVQRQLLDLDEPVATYWPEFAANDKRSITVRQLLAQEAGLHDIRHLIDSGDSLLNHDRIATALAAARPAFEPGTANGYHALTYGYLCDELIRRTTNRTLAQFVQHEFVEPLRLDGFTIGLPDDHRRLAPPPTLNPLSPTLLHLAKTLNLFTRIPPLRIDLKAIAAAFVPPDGTIVGTDEFLASGNGSIGGTFTARSLAEFYCALVTPDSDGSPPIFKPETVAHVTCPHNTRRDRVLSVRPYWRIGYHRPWPHRHTAPDGFGFWGMYSSGAWVDPDQQLAIALVCPDGKGLPLNRINRLINQAVRPATDPTDSHATSDP